MKYVLIEVIEREISTPEFFDTFEAARKEMANRYGEADPYNDYDGLYRDHAYCTNRNHDNCDWKIFELK